jgi:S1-C subfamily serine protease
MIPSQSLAGLYYLFKGYKFHDDKGDVEVSGPVVQIINGERLGARMHPDGYISHKDPEDFEEEQNLGLSIFEASSRLGNRVGTAFLVGQDMVLTNRHVMNYSASDRDWECGQFSIKLNTRDEKVECKKVRYCSHHYDYCVVEMHKMQNHLSLGQELRPLRLSRRVPEGRDVVVLHIGNAGGLGIQASHGRGVRLSGGEIFHFAPTLDGSSGAPIFNEKREVIGINWAYTGHNMPDDDSYNRAVHTQTIFRELQKTHPYTLKEIKSFRSWMGRNIGFREARIEPRTKILERTPSSVRK